MGQEIESNLFLLFPHILYFNYISFIYFTYDLIILLNLKNTIWTESIIHRTGN